MVVVVVVGGGGGRVGGIDWAAALGAVNAVQHGRQPVCWGV